MMPCSERSNNVMQWSIRWFIAGILLVTPVAATAQTPGPAAMAPAPATAAAPLLKAEELDALVAPIALYPDTLLALVLMASTYPLEVVQAERWVSQNKNLKGDELKAAIDKQAWDNSVKSLSATPSVLTMMSSKLDWTQKLGDTVLAQEPDVMDAVQRLRAKAQSNKKLTSTKEQTVTVKQVQQKQVIVIEPTNPNTIHVPYYDPSVVYGGWSYPAYPPYSFPYPGYIAGGIIATGLAFGAGYALGRWASGGNYWGGGVNWNNNNININRPVNINNVGNNWQHRPEHRHGVKYNNPQVQQRFGGQNTRAGSEARMDFRGRSGEQVLKPGGDRPGGDRPGGDRPGGDRPGGDRPGGDRPGGDRAGAGDRGPGGSSTRPGAGDRGPANAARPGTADRGAQRPSTGDRAARPSDRGSAGRPSAGTSAARGPQRDSAFGNVQSGRASQAHSARGQASLGGGGIGGGHASLGGGGGMRGGGGGGGGFRGGGGGGRGGGGGGRRSDVMLKHDIVLLGRLDNGLGLYSFAYNGENKRYVGVIAQEVQAVMPDAVARGRDGYLRVRYDKVGVKFQTYDEWTAERARMANTGLFRR
jgi:hypothetical protein